MTTPKFGMTHVSTVPLRRLKSYRFRLEIQIEIGIKLNDTLDKVDGNAQHIRLYIPGESSKKGEILNLPRPIHDSQYQEVARGITLLNSCLMKSMMKRQGYPLANPLIRSAAI